MLKQKLLACCGLGAAEGELSCATECGISCQGDQGVRLLDHDPLITACGQFMAKDDIDTLPPTRQDTLNLPVYYCRSCNEVEFGKPKATSNEAPTINIHSK